MKYGRPSKVSFRGWGFFLNSNTNLSPDIFGYHNHESFHMGANDLGFPNNLIWSKTLLALIFSPCGEFQWSTDGPVSQSHSPHLHVGAPGILSDLLRLFQILKREWGAESNENIEEKGDWDFRISDLVKNPAGTDI